MKNLSLAFLTIGVIGTAFAFKMSKKHMEADQVIIQTARIAERFEIMHPDTVYMDSIIYKIQYVYAKKIPPDVYFSDTSILSIPPLDRLGVTKFRDSIQTIALDDYIKPPKVFIFQDSNVYLSGTVLATGIQIDSLSVPAKLNITPVWQRSPRSTIEVSILFGNPYITQVSPYTFSRKCPPVLR